MIFKSHTKKPLKKRLQIFLGEKNKSTLQKNDKAREEIGKGNQPSIWGTRIRYIWPTLMKPTLTLVWVFCMIHIYIYIILKTRFCWLFWCLNEDCQPELWSFEVAKHNGSFFEKEFVILHIFLSNGGSVLAKLPDFCRGYAKANLFFFNWSFMWWIITITECWHAYIFSSQTKCPFSKVKSTK